MRDSKEARIIGNEAGKMSISVTTNTKLLMEKRYALKGYW